MQLSPATLNALSKFFAAEAKKASIEVGEYQVDETVTLDVKALVKKFADEQYVPTASVPFKAVVALLLQRMGCTRDAASAVLVEVMTAAINLDADGSDMLLESVENVKQAEARVQKIVGALPPKTRAGKTTVKGGFTVTVAEPVTA